MTGKPRTCTAPGCAATTVARRLCRKHYQQAWKAGALGVHEKQPSRVVNRTICPPDHKHGVTGTCYVHHQCRCNDCATSTTKRNYRRLQLKAYGRYDAGLVDVTRVREHVLMLGEYGIGYKRVAALCGFKSSTPVRTIIWGRQDPGPRYGEMQKRVKRETAEKVLRIHPCVELLADGARIPARGAHRRVQALVTRGWSLSKIARLIGMDITNFSGLMQRDSVLVGTHRAICEVYEDLWNSEPDRSTPAQEAAFSRSLAMAKRNGWAPPLAWDDIDLDMAPDFGTPAEEFAADEQAIELACSGVHVRLHPIERREAVRRLHRERISDRLIAERIGIEPRTVLRIREELNLPGWTVAEQQTSANSTRHGRRTAA